MMHKLNQWITPHWQGWNQRERVLVLTTLIVTLFYLVYLLIYSPIEAALTQARTLAQENQATLRWIVSMKERVQSLPTPKPVSTSELLGIIHDELDDHPRLHAFSYHLTQSSSNHIELKFDAVPFNVFLSWLWALNQHHRFDITQLNVESTDTAGITQLSCVISVT